MRAELGDVAHVLAQTIAMLGCEAIVAAAHVADDRCTSPPADGGHYVPAWPRRRRIACPSPD